MSVNRCYSEKKPGFDVEARSLFSSLHDLLEIKNLTHVRYLCRYDAEGLSGETYEKAKGIVFSEDAAREVNVLISAVTEVMNTAIDAFCNNDLENAYRVEPLEELIDNLCDEMKLHHIDRLQKGICTLNHGFVFNDLITNLERISDHCSNIAVAIIELESDSFDTHEYINSLIEVRSHCFDEYYAEYSKKFVL